MARVIVSPKPEAAAEPRLRWAFPVSLTARILAVNVFALAMLAGGFSYLDSYRARLIQNWITRANRESVLAADALAAASPPLGPALLARMGRQTGTRLRLYGTDGRLLLDSWRLGPPNYVLRDPEEEAWQRHVARFLDRFIDFVAGAREPPEFREPEADRLAAWPAAVAARATGRPQATELLAPDRTPMIVAAAPTRSGETLLMTTNARVVTRTVRAERLRLGVVLLLVMLASVLLSLFLARTIVRPLRRLARAAMRVRLGRAREVMVPRLPARLDEIGSLARAVSDMSQALRQRIDATDAFAADVTHELKNPLASLRSAIEALDKVGDEAPRRQLLAIIRDDVRRLDRLITDIAEASRLDAELSRAQFEPIDLGLLIEAMLRAREMRGANPRGVQIAFARPRRGVAVAMGDESRLVRVIDNLLDNALSFSPDGGLVRITATRIGEDVIVRVEDQGPGVPAELRQDIFRRFHSVRPEGEGFGRHSGLGLAIAKAIVEGHQGRIEVETRQERSEGAGFAIHLPAFDLPS